MPVTCSPVQYYYTAHYIHSIKFLKFLTLDAAEISLANVNKSKLVHASQPSELTNKVIKRLKSLFKTTVRTQSKPQSANCGQSLFRTE
jgi:hypothetical protein